jgi:hypothetical protein
VVVLSIVLVAARQDHPGDGRCAELWNTAANQANRSVVGGRAFLLATGGWTWLLFGAAITETPVGWDVTVSGVRYGTDSPTGGVDGSPNATLQADGSLILDDH